MTFGRILITLIPALLAVAAWEAGQFIGLAVWVLFAVALVEYVIGPLIYALIAKAPGDPIEKFADASRKRARKFQARWRFLSGG